MKKRVEYNIPSSSDDISLDKFQAIVALGEDEVDPIEIVSLLTDIDKKNFKAMREQDVLKIYKLCEQALFDKQKAVKFHWKHEGVTYSLHPEMESMTFGEMTDLQTYFNDPTNYHRAMAVLYRRQIRGIKTNDLYDIEPYTGTIQTGDIFKYIPLSYFYGVRAFFLTIGNELKKISAHYSTQAGTQKAQKSK